MALAPALAIAAGLVVGIVACQQLYAILFHPLRKIPGPWLPAVTSLWIRWQRWHGRLSFTADELLSKYGPVVRISPNMVLINDSSSLNPVFARQDLDTAPESIRALRVGGHDWTVTIARNQIARQRRQPVMQATTNKALKYWDPIFKEYLETFIRNLGRSRGTSSEDIVHHLRIVTLSNSQVVMAGSQAKLAPGNFPHTVGEYNFLVVWRLCLPEWMFTWLRHTPFKKASFRVHSSKALYDFGEKICAEAQRQDPEDPDEHKSVYQLLMERQEKGGQDWTHAEISAEMAGQVLAATETTSSALAFIFYELAKNQSAQQDVYEEVHSAHCDGFKSDDFPLLEACIMEGLRFRPPVALTGSRLVPKGGLDVLGYYIPAGTVLTTQSLSMSRQRPDLFPNYNVFDPTRWLDQDLLSERRRHIAPFGVGARKCPGGNMALYQMRLILVMALREFVVTVAPETTPDSMAPFEANGFRSRFDRCDLIFTPRSEKSL
ncbi:cytochrome P450 monooxygenase [Moelleriella libera RCEF 2490]|uniref:Cytochrome P450 monooxygenase n=1 Tax=Moelleriella libera RCEF 2490 TaxID=1081109 RepID=A0A167W899_9HYPO|nr:cytochrome P450 monooxygenase [Moelleriella libera RCEF 2490]